MQIIIHSYIHTQASIAIATLDTSFSETTGILKLFKELKTVRLTFEQMPDVLAVTHSLMVITLQVLAIKCHSSISVSSFPLEIKAGSRLVLPHTPSPILFSFMQA